MKLFAAKAQSTRIAILSLLALWGVTYLVFIGSLIHLEDTFTVKTVFRYAMCGWMLLPLLPLGLYHNVFGLSGNTIPVWLRYIILLEFCVPVRCLHIAFVWKKRWILLLILGIILLLSASG